MHFKFSISFLFLVITIRKCSTRNVLLLVADDLGLESSISGNNAIKTVNLENLAKRSVNYLNARTTVSSCSPSRGSILTGLASHQHGMYGLHHDYHHFSTFNQVKSIPNLLRKHGIKTGIIGKKHVGPGDTFKFDFEATEENHPILQVGRNITLIKQLTSNFLDIVPDLEFFLMIGFHDPHRCGHSHPELGSFCEYFGDGSVGERIRDWKPIEYNLSQVKVPYFAADTDVSRQDIAAQYKAISRLDQGVGLVLQQLEERGLLNSTLIIFTSDNGSPFLSGRTNLYEAGLRVPLLVSDPFNPTSHGTTNELAAVTLLDILPTVVDFMKLKQPKDYKVNGRNIHVTGKSLLAPDVQNSVSFGSHNLHEITMYYPMRSVSVPRYKLIHNLNHKSPFMIDQDFYLSPTFQDVLNRTREGKPTNWSKTLNSYYYRPEFELFDLSKDPQELVNVVDDVNYQSIKGLLTRKLEEWQKKTGDPWLCAPRGVLMDFGPFKNDPFCQPLENEV